MNDISVYSEHEKYEKYQNLRPDYVKAIQRSILLARKYLENVENPKIADFCCGTGSNSKILAKSINSIDKIALIDINKGFLKIAKNSKINAKKIEIHESDILNADLEKEYDLVLSIFAYHHIKDSEKLEYVRKIMNCLKPNGILILTEIYLKDIQQAVEYYSYLFNHIPKDKVVPGLKEFLDQTARSSDFEFKVTKDFADKQFEENGFSKIEEIKIYPSNDFMGKDVGTFVQIYRL